MSENNPEIHAAFDLGTHAGYAVGKLTGEILASGTRKFEVKGLVSEGLRARQFVSFVTELIQEHNVTKVYYEVVVNHPTFVQTRTIHLYGGFEMLLNLAAAQFSIPVKGIPIQHIKQVATGKGNAPKPHIERAARHQWTEIMIVDDNHADALWTLRTGILMAQKKFVPPPSAKARKKAKKAQERRQGNLFMESGK